MSVLCPTLFQLLNITDNLSWTNLVSLFALPTKNGMPSGVATDFDKHLYTQTILNSQFPFCGRWTLVQNRFNLR